MRPHFASTLHAVRQMTPHVTRQAVEATSPRRSATRPAPPARKPNAVVTNDKRRVLVLPEGESLTIVGSDGQTLLEIASGAKGPEIRLVHDNLRIECPGQLDLAAGAINLEANEDVTVQGRTIRLN